MYREAFRVLKVGGRIAISDVVAIAPIPLDVIARADKLAACISGAAPIEDVRRMMTDAGFTSIAITIAPAQLGDREFLG